MAAVRGAPSRARGPALRLLALLGLAVLTGGGLFAARQSGACPPQKLAAQQRREVGRPAASREAPAVAQEGEPAFKAEGYDLPPECAKHTVLYGQIYNDLAPWFDTGISDEDVDACGVPRGGSGGP